MNTGKWVGQAGEPIIILKRGQPVAALGPVPAVPRTPFGGRKKVRGFASLPPVAADSGTFLEEDRR